MSPVNDVVFGDIGAKSPADQRRQKFWGEPAAGALDVQISRSKLVSFRQRSGGHHAFTATEILGKFTGGWSLDAGAERCLNMTDGRHHLPESSGSREAA